MAKAKGSTSGRKAGTMANQVRRTGGQGRMRRELAAQRRAMGAAGVQRAMKNWGLRASSHSRSGGGTRGGRGSASGRNG